MTEIVVLDACVLVPYNLSSLLLTLAEAELFQPRWSEPILQETERALVEKLGRPAEMVARRLDAMREAFPEASVHGFESLESGLTCDPKDRHVLAAAIASGATAIVTANLKDFPEASCAPHDVVVLHPEHFLLDLLASSPTDCGAAVEREAARTRRPPLSAGGLLAGIADIAPTFANTLHQMLLDGNPPLSDIPAYVATRDEDTPLSDWAHAHNPENPLHVAFAWWTALLDRHEYGDVLRDLTHSPAAFGDYEWAAELLQARSIASKVYYAVDAAERLAFVRFVPEVAQSSQVFAPFAIRGPIFMTLCRQPDGVWKVWGLGPVMVGSRSVFS